ncbi:HAD family phosphatase [Streptomyces misionensis]|uniref:HAD family phosphatase n=1 Tax=Streptomyces misionensis TaxID=67331 RepID=A0A5C6JXX7_9ACTN|nr:HAD family phosphatase [Streptomyces misionensis]TWV48868.1 HAD family phosphatase [Streptomyces misionensis]
MSGLGALAVTFDLDGTLVDSEPNYYEASRRVLAEQGVTDYGWAEHQAYVGIGTWDTALLWRERHGLRAPAEDLLDATDRHYLELARAHTRVYPEMRGFLELLAADGVPTAVASGSTPQAMAAVLAGTGLGALVRVVVSVADVPRGKPAPDVFLEAARRLGADPADCVVLEDAAPGAVAAHVAGMRCIAIPYVAAQADAPGFATADLLLRGGQPEFTARSAYAWLQKTAQMT